MAMTPLARPG